MAFGKNIRHLRKLVGDPTRMAIAQAIGLDDDQVIYAMESRDSAYSKHARALADYFRVNFEVLLTCDLTGMELEEIRKLAPPPGPGAARNEKKPAEYRKSAQEALSDVAALVGVYARVPEDLQKLILNFARDVEKRSQG